MTQNPAFQILAVHKVCHDFFGHFGHHPSHQKVYIGEINGHDTYMYIKYKRI